MKKFLLVAVLAAVPYAAHSIGGDLVPPAEMLQINNMQMLEEQRFRNEEVNDYKEIKDEKIRFWKKKQSPDEKINELKQEIQQNQQKIIQPSQRSEFIKENGQLRIKYY